MNDAITDDKTGKPISSTLRYRSPHGMGKRPKGVNWIAGEWAKRQLALATAKEATPSC